ncbi:MAG: lumazine-binding protein, partial [Mycolicibacterium sp.]|nr:lumazine-binding protein [Mycolicibacterium sp.]
AKGARFVDDVTGIAVTGDRATATVLYHFERTPDAKISSPMTFLRENDRWKVCSPGPR